MFIQPKDIFLEIFKKVAKRQNVKSDDLCLMLGVDSKGKLDIRIECNGKYLQVEENGEMTTRFSMRAVLPLTYATLAMTYSVDARIVDVIGKLATKYDKDVTRLRAVIMKEDLFVTENKGVDVEGVFYLYDVSDMANPIDFLDQAQIMEFVS